MLYLILYIVLIALLYYAITSLLPIAEPFLTVLKFVFLILIIMVILQMFGFVSVYPVRGPKVILP